MTVALQPVYIVIYSEARDMMYQVANGYGMGYYTIWNVRHVIACDITDYPQVIEMIVTPMNAAASATGHYVSTIAIVREPDSFLREKAITLEQAEEIDYTKAESWE